MLVKGLLFLKLIVVGVVKVFEVVEMKKLQGKNGVVVECRVKSYLGYFKIKFKG